MFEEKPLAPKPRPPEISSKKRIMFFAGTGVTIALVLVGWGFSLKDRFTNFNFFLFPTNQLTQLKDEVKKSASDLQAGVAEPLNEATNLAKEASEQIQTTDEKTEQLEAVVGEALKENLVQQKTVEENGMVNNNP